MQGGGKIIPPKRKILANINLSFFPGAKIGVLGLNGSGKSSLLRIMAGFDKEIEGFGELFRFLSFKKIGTSTIQSRALAGVANGTYIFVLPGSPSACKDAWDEILLHQLDYRHKPCNFVEILPRLEEHKKRK